MGDISEDERSAFGAFIHSCHQDGFEDGLGLGDVGAGSAGDAEEFFDVVMKFKGRATGQEDHAVHAGELGVLARRMRLLSFVLGVSG